MFGELFDIMVPVSADYDGAIDHVGLISGFDTDGDNVADQFAIDFNGDGYFDRYVEGHMDDLNLDSSFDSIGIDTDGDMYDDMRIFMDDFGDVSQIDVSDSFLSQFENMDVNYCPGDGHGIFDDFQISVFDYDAGAERDVMLHGIDINGDGTAEYFGLDFDGDGVHDLLAQAHAQDINDDGIIDQYILDTNGDLSPDTFIYLNADGNIEDTFANSDLLDNYNEFMFGN